MAKLFVKGIVFDMDGTIVDLGAVASVCNEVTSDPLAFNTLWRAKQLEYTFLRSLIGRYRDFWKVTEEALEFTLQRFAIQVSSEQRRDLMDAWLHPSPYPEVALPRLKEKYLLAILSIIQRDGENVPDWGGLVPFLQQGIRLTHWSRCTDSTLRR